MIQNIRLYILDIIGSLYFDLPESNRRSKIGFWLSIFKYISTIKLKLCSEYIIRDENNFIGEKLMDSIGHNVEGADLTFNFVGWEKLTKYSIWRILSVTLLLDGYHSIEVKNRKTGLILMGGARTVEPFSYTFRFW